MAALSPRGVQTSDLMQETAVLKADVNFLYGLLEKARIERDEHLTVIARMRAAMASKDHVMGQAVESRNAEKTIFEAGLRKERAAYAEEIGKRDREKNAILRAQEKYITKWVATVSQIALDINRDANKTRLEQLLKEAVDRFPEAKQVPSRLLECMYLCICVFVFPIARAVCCHSSHHNNHHHNHHHHNNNNNHCHRHQVQLKILGTVDRGTSELWKDIFMGKVPRPTTSTFINSRTSPPHHTSQHTPKLITLSLYTYNTNFQFSPTQMLQCGK
jgi:hypothetical protein